MTAPPEHDVRSPSLKEGSMNDPSPPTHSITLSTSVNDSVITITGDGAWTLHPGAPVTEFQFTLDDTSSANVQFDSLDAADNMSTCPPVGSGNQSTQIDHVVMTNNGPNKSARFNDNNSNPASNGPMNVSYQWNFRCDPGHRVMPFDPIISNGGRLSK